MRRNMPDGIVPCLLTRDDPSLATLHTVADCFGAMRTNCERTEFGLRIKTQPYQGAPLSINKQRPGKRKLLNSQWGDALIELKSCASHFQLCANRQRGLPWSKCAKQAGSGYWKRF